MKKYKITYQLRDDHSITEDVSSSIDSSQELAARIIYFGKQDGSICIEFAGSSFCVPYEQILFVSVTEVKDA